jgi:ABC-type antimicrobial peptide transport system permease subunit
VVAEKDRRDGGRQVIFGQVARILSSKRAIFFLLLILLTTSAAFAVTSSILLSVDNTASGMLGESRNTIVIAQANSRAPFLGTLPIGLASVLRTVSGVKVVSPEVFAPSTLSNQPIMVRGVDPTSFMELQNPAILEGSALDANDTTQAMVGETLARQMNLHPGSEITVVGGVRATVAQLTVKAVFSTGTPLDNEVIAPLWVGNWLRGVSYGVVSILRIEVVAQDSPSQVAVGVQRAVENSSKSTAGAGQTPGEGLLPVSSTVTSFAGHVVEASPDVSSAFFSKTVGLSQENILLISSLVFVSMSVAIVCALQEAVFRSRNELGTLRTIGMSSRRLSWNLVLVATSLSFVASVAGLLIGWEFLSLVAKFSPVQIAFYAVDPRSAFATAALYSVIVVTAAGFIAAALSSLRFRESLVVYEMTLPYLESDLGDLNE